MKETFTIEYHKDRLTYITAEGIVYATIKQTTKKKVDLAKKMIKTNYRYPVYFEEDRRFL